jgi:hypothetical protein
VQQFDTGAAAGSMTDGMSHSRLHRLTVRDNRLAGISLGSGAGVAASHGSDGIRVLDVARDTALVAMHPGRTAVLPRTSGTLGRGP